MYTKEQIQTKLRTDQKWIERSLVVLYERQTSDEQTTGETREFNGIGFNSSDSRYLSWVASYLLRDEKNHLNQKHLEKCGSRLPKYWRQIQELIKEKSGN